MKIALISDTHEQHFKITVPECDLLIHAGDFTYNGDIQAIRRFNEWLEQIPAKHKVVIAGNHDLSLDPNNRYYRTCMDHLGGVPAESLLTNCIYLNDSGCEIEGLKIWGSPIQPWFHDWAFNRTRGEEIDAHWQKIPEDTDILVTHGPPAGILDKPFGKMAPVGCEMLMRHVIRVRPMLMVFGHIHGSAGIHRDSHTTFVNASSVDEAYRIRKEPVVLIDSNEEWPL